MGGYTNVRDVGLGYEWWLRDSSETDPSNAAVVTSTGDSRYTNKQGFHFDGLHTFVRPAICIELFLGYAQPAQ